MTADLAALQLQNLQDDLHALRDMRTTPHAFSTAARSHAVLLAALPPRYGEVLLGLLDRLEAGALFTEESCSFSHKELVDSLQMWVDKARAALLKE
jgi:plasmid stability protein